MSTVIRKMIIIGGGPAGYTAALYAARANLEPLVIEGFQWGGQLMITSDVENYPGYPEGVLGPEMMAEFRRQAERFGAEFITDDVDARGLLGAAVLGVRRRRGVSRRGGRSSRRARPRGSSGSRPSSACRGRASRTAPSATQPSAATIRRSSSAAATPRWRRRSSSRSSRARSRVIHRRDEFRASPIMLDRARANEKIEFVTNAVVDEVLGESAR